MSTNIPSVGLRCAEEVGTQMIFAHIEMEGFALTSYDMQL